MDALAAQDIDYNEVVLLLEKEGVDKFEVAWTELLGDVRKALEAVGKASA